MTNDQLIARQAKQLEELKDDVADLSNRLKQIRLNIICIGGPLNDNKLHYSHEQLRVFSKILEWAEP